jgi:hypothetical protein
MMKIFYKEFNVSIRCTVQAWSGSCGEWSGGGHSFVLLRFLAFCFLSAFHRFVVTFESGLVSSKVTSKVIKSTNHKKKILNNFLSPYFSHR